MKSQMYPLILHRKLACGFYVVTEIRNGIDGVNLEAGYLQVITIK
jgi:hypothetical protein